MVLWHSYFSVFCTFYFSSQPKVIVLLRWLVGLGLKVPEYFTYFYFMGTTLGVVNRTLAYRLKCSPMARETWVQSQVESYQRLKKWYLMPPCLTLSIIRYGSRVKWNNPRKGVAPSPTPCCSKLSKRKPSGHLRQWSPTLLTYTLMNASFLTNPGTRHA